MEREVQEQREFIQILQGGPPPSVSIDLSAITAVVDRDITVGKALYSQFLYACLGGGANPVAVLGYLIARAHGGYKQRAPGHEQKLSADLRELLDLLDGRIDG